MVKKVLFILCVSLLLPLQVFASTKLDNYDTTNLKETLELAGIEIKNPNYEETDEQVPVYLFWSTTCQYTKPLLEYFNSISDEYGKYFKLVAFDVTYNTKNIDLFREVGPFLGEEQMGVPFYVIGKKYFPGYNKDATYEIADAIMREYNSANKYDVFEEMAKQEGNVQEEKPEEDFKKFHTTILIFVLNIFVIVIVLIPFVLISNKRIKKIKKSLKKLKDKF